MCLFNGSDAQHKNSLSLGNNPDGYDRGGNFSESPRRLLEKVGASGVTLDFEFLMEERPGAFKMAEVLFDQQEFTEVLAVCR